MAKEEKKQFQCQHCFICGPQMGEENVGRCIECGYIDYEERNKILNSKEYKEECIKYEKEKKEREKFERRECKIFF